MPGFNYLENDKLPNEIYKKIQIYQVKKSEGDSCVDDFLDVLFTAANNEKDWLSENIQHFLSEIESINKQYSNPDEEKFNQSKILLKKVQQCIGNLKEKKNKISESIDFEKDRVKTNSQSLDILKVALSKVMISMTLSSISAFSSFPALLLCFYKRGESQRLSYRSTYQALQMFKVLQANQSSRLSHSQCPIDGNSFMPTGSNSNNFPRRAALGLGIFGVLLFGFFGYRAYRQYQNYKQKRDTVYNEMKDMGSLLVAKHKAASEAEVKMELNELFSEIVSLSSNGKLTNK